MLTFFSKGAESIFESFAYLKYSRGNDSKHFGAWSMLRDQNYFVNQNIVCFWFFSRGLDFEPIEAVSEPEIDPIQTSESEPPQEVKKDRDLKEMLQQSLEIGFGGAAVKTKPQVPLEAILIDDANDPRHIVLRHYFSKNHFPGPAYVVRKSGLTRVEAQDVLKKAMDELVHKETKSF